MLHCLPGAPSDKGVAIEHLRSLARPGARVFGATLLHDGVHRNWYARAVMARNNRHGIFSNTHDSLEAVRDELARHLADLTVEVIGCVGVFAGNLRAPGLAASD